MNILILGGTIFLGRHLVTAALERGHKVTIFHRGVHPSPFSKVREILGDRNSELQVLGQQNWDVVIDTNGYLPESVARSADALKAHTRQYVFISTISVYSDLSLPGITEESPVAILKDPSVRTITGETYGALKVLCEKEVLNIYGENTLIVRPGFIVGPHDPTGRFTYWPHRIRQGGEVLVPEPPEASMQFVDVRDLAAFTVTLVERGMGGVVNVTGPAEMLTMQQFVESCRAVTQSSSSFVWIPEKLLSLDDNRETPSIPLWLPAAYSNMGRLDIAKAIGLGLKFRPLDETISDTLQWLDHDLRNTKSLEQFLSRQEESEWIMRASQGNS